MEYTAPSVTELGSVHELTLQGMNKVGSTPDGFSNIIVGSVVPFP